MNDWLANRLEDSPGQYVLLGSHVLADQSLSAGAVRLYALIRHLAGSRTWVMVTLADVGVLTGVVARQVARHRDELVARGLVATSRGSGDGLTWTLLPPDIGVMGAVADQLRLLAAGSAPDKDVHSPAGAVPPPPGQESAGGLGRSSHLHRRVNETTGKEKTEGEANARALTRPSGHDLKVLAVALSTKMKDRASATLRVAGQPDSPSVTWHDVMAWLQADVHWTTVLNGWQTWLEHEGRRWEGDRSDALHLDLVVRGHSRFDRGGSRRAFIAFTDWLLAGGEMADVDDLQRLPVHEVLDLKAAARRVRSNSRKQIPVTRLHLERSELHDLSLAGAGFRLVLADMTDHDDVTRLDWRPSRAAFSLAVGVLQHRAASSGWFDDPATAVAAADELLEAGIYAPDEQSEFLPEEMRPDCLSPSGYHAEKHRLAEMDGEVCTSCAGRAVVECGGTGASDVDLCRAVIHDARLWCTGCVAELVSEQVGL